ncbi:MAG: zinc ribbon domain-containing protein [Roseburia sp.]|nr:zinc ribbon domain-containing protein [Anaeroplasma bactoclasticum]MCM1196594.1 zinc ribbon domain-containing protein [Roseburia sp.]MCM1556036.1 zinc ribbon domain-containing protein [Anaeroplasma bactoclasticum]
MNCKYCSTENDEDAVYCINCGRRLDEKLICSSCGVENDVDSKFCKECGHALFKSVPKCDSFSKEHCLSLGKMVFKIIAASIAAFILLFSFASCFAPFLTLYGKGLSLFDFIKDLDAFKAKPAGTYGADFYMLGKILPDIICIIGISIALIGCTIALIWGGVKAILSGMKKKIPDLDCQGLLATISLLGGMLLSSLLFTSNSSMTTIVSSAYTMKYGGVVLAAVSVGLAWYFLNYICHFVLDFINGLTKKEIFNRAFKFGEAILLCVILFNLCSSFLTFVRTEEMWNGVQGKYTSNISIAALFTNLSQAVYNQTGDVDFVFATSSVAGGYYLTMAILITFIVILVVGVIFIFFRLKNTTNKIKASLGMAILLVVMAVTELTLTIVATHVFASKGGVFQMLMGQTESLSSQIGASIIVFVVFSLLLLSLEIVWLIMNKNIENKKEIEAYDM